jgi:hypothetical protein
MLGLAHFKIKGHYKISLIRGGTTINLKKTPSDNDAITGQITESMFSNISYVLENALKYGQKRKNIIYYKKC